MASRAGVGEALAGRAARVGVLRQLLRFGAVGALAGITDYVSLQLLIEVGVFSELAKAVSFAFGSTVGYLLNRRWTFLSSRDAREVASVMGAYGVALVLNVSGYATLRFVLPDMPWKITVCWLGAQVLATACNFVVQRGWVFRSR